MIRKNDNCRACLNKELKLVLRYKPSPIGDEYITKENLNMIQPLYPIDLYQCADCGFTQLLDVIDPEILYGNYIYQTKSSPGLQKHFTNFAKTVVNKIKPNKNELVIDIGCNDGVLLKEFKKLNLEVIGIEPAKEIAAENNKHGILTYGEFLNETLTNDIISNHGLANIITSNNVFANIDDINEWTKCVKRLLSDDGVYIFESFYLADLIKNKVFDFIYHEHLSAFSVKPLKTFFEMYSMEIFDIERIYTKGGSLRYYVQNTNGKNMINTIVDEFIAEENSMGLYKSEIYNNFYREIDEIKKRTRNILLEAKKNGKKIAGFGASITCTTLIYHFEIEDMIDYLVDDNELKQGTFLPGKHIPVYPPDHLISEKPDILIILAWRFKDPIIANNKNLLSNIETVITPLPYFETN
ncbi:class I SAM-dependent methyltransferase [Pelagibacteraceae bacterium]|nr:class I SAM-dependent methyltransferase [Pelagibacteraceae bacterium]